MASKIQSKMNPSNLSKMSPYLDPHLLIPMIEWHLNTSTSSPFIKKALKSRYLELALTTVRSKSLSLSPYYNSSHT